jgi:hypothetical protein
MRVPIGLAALVFVSVAPSPMHKVAEVADQAVELVPQQGPSLAR